LLLQAEPKTLHPCKFYDDLLKGRGTHTLTCTDCGKSFALQLAMKISLLFGWLPFPEMAGRPLN